MNFLCRKSGRTLAKTPEQRRLDDVLVLAIGVGSALFMFAAAFFLTR